MTVFTVHAPAPLSDGPEATDRAVFIAEGFGLAAFLVPPLWALYRRQWLAFGLWLGVSLIIAAIGLGFGAPLAWVLSMGFALWFALSARDFRRAALERQGWHLVGIVDAATSADAEYKFFARHMGEIAAAPAPGPLPELRPAVVAANPFPPVVGYLPSER